MQTITFIYLFVWLVLFIYFFGRIGSSLALGFLHWAFSSCGEPGLLFIVVRGLLIPVASLVVEHRL